MTKCINRVGSNRFVATDDRDLERTCPHDAAKRIDQLLTSLGLSFTFTDDSPMVIADRLLLAIGKRKIGEALANGAVVDISAAEHIHGMGLEDSLGVAVGERVRSFGGLRFDDPAFAIEPCDAAVFVFRPRQETA